MASVHPGVLLRHIRQLLEPRPGPLPDQELLRHYVEARDEAAFTRLVERHGGLVLGVCRRVLGDAHEAEDAFQATFLVLACKAASIRKHESLTSWLSGVAFRLARKARHAAARRRAREAARAIMPFTDPTAETGHRDVHGVLDEELQRLPARYRAPLLLCCLEGKTREEAAEQLGWSEGAIKGNLQRGRQVLQQRLARRGVALSAAGMFQMATPAQVSATLIQDTARAAVMFAARPGLLGAATGTHAAALANGALRTMLLTRLALAATMLTGILGLGGSVILGGGEPAAAEPTAVAQAPARSEPAVDVQEARDRATPPAEARPFVPQKKWVDLDFNGDPLPDGALARLGKLQVNTDLTVQSVAFDTDRKSARTYARTPHRWQVDTGAELPAPQRDSQWPNPFADHRYLFSPDGKTLALEKLRGDYGSDGVLLVDLTTGKELHLKSHPKEGYCRWMAFSADGKRLASVGGIYGESKEAVPNRARVWDVATGKEVAAFDGGGPVAFSPDGKLLACGGLQASETGGYLHFYRGFSSSQSDAQTIRLWDIGTGKLLRQMEKVSVHGFVHALVFAPDGKTLVYQGTADGPHHQDDAFCFWEVATGRLRRRFPAQPNDVACFAFSPDSKTLATGGADGMVRLWEMATGKERRQFRGHIGAISCLAFAPDGRRLASGSADTTVLIWDLTRR
jgi:RNA polymerase sigma factor (sigma-70 family)